MNLAIKIQNTQNLQRLKMLASGLKSKLVGDSLARNKVTLEKNLGEFFPIFEDFVSSDALNTPKDLNQPSISAINKLYASNSLAIIDNFLLYLNSISVLDLTLAFNPTPKFLQEVLFWLNKNVSNNIVLKVNYQEDIVAGALITYNGKYGDFSTRNKLDALFNHTQELKI
ncbi:hypothetical protein HYV31_00285 [candidate division WWE3 bacterium]|nr:hypothetical protein [candidate division WWE3 bacterium]